MDITVVCTELFVRIITCTGEMRGMNVTVVDLFLSFADVASQTHVFVALLLGFSGAVFREKRTSPGGSLFDGKAARSHRCS